MASLNSPCLNLTIKILCISRTGFRNARHSLLKIYYQLLLPRSPFMQGIKINDGRVDHGVECDDSDASAVSSQVDFGHTTSPQWHHLLSQYLAQYHSHFSHLIHLCWSPFYSPIRTQLLIIPRCYTPFFPQPPFSRKQSFPMESSLNHPCATSGPP